MAQQQPATIEELASPAFDSQRFRMELEFVQMLANPEYLHRAFLSVVFMPLATVVKVSNPHKKIWQNRATSRTRASTTTSSI